DQSSGPRNAKVLRSRGRLKFRSGANSNRKKVQLSAATTGKRFSRSHHSRLLLRRRCTDRLTAVHLPILKVHLRRNLTKGDRVASLKVIGRIAAAAVVDVIGISGSATNASAVGTAVPAAAVTGNPVAAVVNHASNIRRSHLHRAMHPCS